jgi:hypothetical protein
MFSRFFLTRIAAAVIVFLPAALSAEEFSSDHVAISYSGISKKYAEAIVRTLSQARNAAMEQFAFDMPEKIYVEISVKPEGKVNLFTDGQDHVFLTIRSEKDLCKPAVTGIYQLYGMCHEVGHLAMYRLIHDHSWMQGTAAEAWAHYLGSRLVDAVYAKEGPNLWPDRYDYLEDGTRRMEEQLSAEEPTDTAKAAGVWKQLAECVGDKGIAPIFQAWGKIQVDSGDPEKELGKALLAHSGTQTRQWWNDSQDLLIHKRPKSPIPVETAPETGSASAPQELAWDDGKSTGQRSIAGTGHAVRFGAPGDSCYLTEVRLYGSRYGYPAPPAENFHVWLCDQDFKVISDNPFPYSKFTRGNPRWVGLKLSKPVKVPPEFIICVGFNPTGTKGVYVHFDGESSGYSLVGLPGEPGEEFSEGDWMIRAKVEKRQVESK